MCVLAMGSLLQLQATFNGKNTYAEHCVCLAEICLIKGVVKITLVKGLHFLMVNIKN